MSLTMLWFQRQLQKIINVLFFGTKICIFHHPPQHTHFIETLNFTKTQYYSIWGSGGRCRYNYNSNTSRRVHRPSQLYQHGWVGMTRFKAQRLLKSGETFRTILKAGVHVSWEHIESAYVKEGAHHLTNYPPTSSPEEFAVHSPDLRTHKTKMKANNLWPQ